LLSVKRWTKQIVIYAAIATAACGDAPAEATRPGDSAFQRTYFDLPSPSLIIGADTLDSLIQMTRLAALDDSLLYVFDYGDRRLNAFDLEDGHLRWAFGRLGEGPGEFRNPWQIVLRSNEYGVYAVDPALRRITLVRSGQLIREIPMPTVGLVAERLVPLEDRLIVTLMGAEDRYLASLDTAGTPSQESGAYPSTEINDLASSNRQSFIAPIENGDRWVAGFMMTNQFAVYDGFQPTCVGRVHAGANPVDVTEINPRIWQAGIGVVGSTLAILARETAESEEFGVLELYRVTDCGYVASVRVPPGTKAFAANDRYLALIIEDPAPRVALFDAQSMRN
jgi:hypothetical protein